uniref:Glycoside hydrolase family 1 protein n=1 Tax=Fervidobacterium thailandense TaxID=1008305 RepID=A0A7C5RIU3_9BACT
MFPKGFMFGVSMSGFQFEMGWGDERDLDPNTDWFVWVREPGNLVNGVVSGDLPEFGVGYWLNYEKVHKLAVEFGMDTIRIGIEWSRIFPNSTESVDIQDPDFLRKLDALANSAAVEHYRRIMEDIKSKGLKLFVNLYHFTLPLWIHDPVAVHYGKPTDRLGWVSKKTVHEFAKYVAYVAWKYGDIVDIWSTMNEPHVVSQLGYFTVSAGFPPAYFNPDWYILATKHLAMAHNLAYDNIKRFSNKPAGVIYSFTWYDTLKPDTQEIFDEAMYLTNWFYMDMVKDKLDYVGVNYYTRAVIEKVERPLVIGDFNVHWRILKGYGYTCDEGGIALSGRPASDFGWEMYPEGLYYVLKAVAERYSKPIIVTENGVADWNDRIRSLYLISHLYYVERALEEGLDVRGYLHWSIVDNYEWAKGYSKRFGLAWTNFETKTFHPRPSMYVFRDIISMRTTKGYTGFDPYNVFTNSKTSFIIP